MNASVQKPGFEEKTGFLEKRSKMNASVQKPGFEETTGFLEKEAR